MGGWDPADDPDADITFGELLAFFTIIIVIAIIVIAGVTK